MRKGFLYSVATAKRPETRAARIAKVVEMVARNVSRAELMERAGFRKKKTATKRAKPERQLANQRCAVAPTQRDPASVVPDSGRRDPRTPLHSPASYLLTGERIQWRRCTYR